MIIDEFIKYEKEKGLFQLEIKGFKYWHYIRKTVHDEISHQNETIGQAHSTIGNERYYKRILLKLKQIPYWIFKNPFHFLDEKDMLIFNHPRRVKNGEFFDCIYTDGILDKIDHSYYVFEYPILEKHFTPVRTKNLRYLDYLNFKIALNVEIKRKLFKFKFKNSDIHAIREVLENIESEFNIKIDENKIFNLLEISYLSRKLYRKYYGNILDKINPKIIIQLVSYSRDDYFTSGIPVWAKTRTGSISLKSASTQSKSELMHHLREE